MNTNTNDRAFPSTFHNGWGEPEKGMTLRDYFAAKALQGYLADLEWRKDVSPTGTAYAAYRVADAMLKAREA